MEGRPVALYQILDLSMACRLVYMHTPGEPIVRSGVQLTAGEASHEAHVARHQACRPACTRSGVQLTVSPPPPHRPPSHDRHARRASGPRDRRVPLRCRRVAPRCRPARDLRPVHLHLPQGHVARAVPRGRVPGRGVWFAGAGDVHVPHERAALVPRVPGGDAAAGATNSWYCAVAIAFCASVLLPIATIMHHARPQACVRMAIKHDVHGRFKRTRKHSVMVDPPSPCL
jgi:hypothetical protein